MTDTGLAGLAERHAARMRALDPLLNAQASLPTEGRRLDVPTGHGPDAHGPDAHGPGAHGPDAHGPDAAGWVRLVELDPDTSAAGYGKLRQFLLNARWSGPPAGADLDAVLDAFGDWVHGFAPDDDSQAGLSWPSRDVEAARLFAARGLVPGSAVAVRTVRTDPTRDDPARTDPDGVLVRPATPADAEAIGRLNAAEIEYEAGLSTLTVRPGLAARSAAEHAATIQAALDADRAVWTWVAERAGAVVAVLALQRPEESRWITGLTAAAPACYLPLLSVLPEHRSSGIGRALVARAHAAADHAGVAAILLHYSVANPLSVPFWSRHGYRPLSTTWSVWPAQRIR